MKSQLDLSGQPASVISRSCQEVSPVSPSLQPGSERARMMTVISGRRCCESLDLSNPAGLLLKTFMESPAWQSDKAFLQWKMIRKANVIRVRKELLVQKTISGESCRELSKTSKKQDIYSRDQPMAHQSFLLCQLVVLEPTIRDTESLSLDMGGENQDQVSPLIPTVTTQDASGHKYQKSKGRICRTLAGTIPTVTKADSTMGDLKGKEYNGKTKHAMKLGQAINLCPTLNAGSSHSGFTFQELGGSKNHLRNNGEIRGLRLQPAFAEWMMDFPEGWTALDASEMQLYLPKCTRSSKRSRISKTEGSE